MPTFARTTNSQPYREEVSRLQLELKEARTASSRAEAAKTALEHHNAQLRDDFSSQVSKARETTTGQIVALRNELAEQDVALLETQSKHRVLLNEMTLAKQRVVQALEDTDMLAREELFAKAVDGGSGGGGGGGGGDAGLSSSRPLFGATSTTATDREGGTHLVRVVMRLIGRLNELHQQFRLTKEMLQQQSEGLAQMKALARGESATASSRAMQMQMELASRDQAAFERAKKLEQQHAAQLRQVEEAHRTVQDNLAAEIKELRSRLLEAVRASSSAGVGSGGVGDAGGMDAARLASLMDDLGQWRSRAQTLESTIVALRHETHEMRYEHDIQRNQATAEAARLREELSGRLARLSRDARAEAVKAEVNIKCVHCDLSVVIRTLSLGSAQETKTGVASLVVAVQLCADVIHHHQQATPHRSLTHWRYHTSSYRCMGPPHFTPVQSSPVHSTPSLHSTTLLLSHPFRHKP